MHFHGSFEVPVARDDLFSFLVDPPSVISVIPDVIESKVVDEEHFTVKAKAGVGPVKGIVDMEFAIAKQAAGSRAVLRGRGRGMQSTVDLTLSLDLDTAGTGSRATWDAEATVGGMLASVGGRLIGGVVERYVKQITADLEKSVSQRK